MNKFRETLIDILLMIGFLSPIIMHIISVSLKWPRWISIATGVLIGFEVVGVMLMFISIIFIGNETDEESQLDY